ncbi:MAG: zf-HC2 domain-containing protein [Bacillaceae bacterium]|nr:zf-HC2 domain-containing protein [Bacillaceae bacterium]
MNCKEVQKLTSEYNLEQLPEVTARRVEHHLDSCPACNLELQISEHHADSLDCEIPEHFSVADQVMDRIYQDQKWALPVTQHVVRLSQRMKMLGVTIAAMLLIFFTATAVLSPVPHTDQAAGNGEWVTLKADQTISAVQPIEAESVYISNDTNSSSQILASIDAPIFYSESVADEDAGGLNLYIASSLLGLLMTLIVVSWMVRV